MRTEKENHCLYDSCHSIWIKIQATYQMTELYFLHINQSFVQFFYSIPKVVTSTWTPYPIYKKIRDLSSTGNESGIHSVDFTGKHYLSLFPDLKITRWTSTCTFLHTIEVWETWEPLNVLQNIPEKREMYILNACCLKVYKRTSWLHNLKKQQQRMSKKHSLLDRGSYKSCNTWKSLVKTCNKTLKLHLQAVKLLRLCMPVLVWVHIV